MSATQKSQSTDAWERTKATCRKWHGGHESEEFVENPWGWVRDFFSFSNFPNFQFHSILDFLTQAGACPNAEHEFAGSV